MELTKEQQTNEIFKCMSDIEYFAEKYCKVWDKKNSRWIPFRLMPHQVKVLRDYENNDRNIVLKYRQGGITTLTCLYLAHIIFTNSDLKIAIVANQKKLAIDEILTNVCNILASLPDWLTFKPTLKDASDHKIYSNNTQIKAFAATKNGVRGFSPDILLIDEAAYLDFGYEFWTSAQGSLSAGGRVFMISTPKSHDDLYYPTYEGARTKKNKFHISEIYWWWDARFNEDLSFRKTIDDENIDVITDLWLEGVDSYGFKKLDVEKCKKLIKEGYKPTSTWYEGECAGYNYDKKRIAQELENKFLGSGGNMIDEEYITYQESVNVKEPIRYEWHDKNLWIWDEPLPDTEYYIVIDVSSGSSSDYMAIQIMDIKNSCQVAEYQGRIKPEEVADLAYKYAKRYNNAFIIIDVTGTIGSVIIYKLMNETEYNYKNVYKSKFTNKVVKDKLENFVEDDFTPGFYIGKNRSLLLENFEQYIRLNYFICRSIRLVNEMKTFVWSESLGRFDHTRSSHDDLLFAAAIGLYVYNESFVISKRGYDKEKALAFINSWTVVTGEDKMVKAKEDEEKLKKMPMLFYIPKK